MSNTAALLDFPFHVSAITDPLSEAYGSLLDFENLVKEHRLERTPFLEAEELNEQINSLWGPGGSWQNSRLGRVIPVLRRYVRTSDSTLRAHPMQGPNDWPAAWRRGLRDGMQDLEDWRTPQIIVPASRIPVWAGDATTPAALQQRGTVTIECDDHAGRGEERVLASLEFYDLHDFARSDWDPWDLERIHRDDPVARPHPCRLPRPPAARGVALSDLPDALSRARADGWNIGGRYFYIPPAAWDPFIVSCNQWREGRAFPAGRRNNRPGPIDHFGNVWHWDADHGGHWDVQLAASPPPYLKINHDGDTLMIAI